jgi:hypothetical protein
LCAERANQGEVEEEDKEENRRKHGGQVDA